MKKKFEFENVCCGKEMSEVNGYGQLNNNINEAEAYICFECGRFVYFVDETLDEEEVDNYREQYENKPN